MTLAQAAARLRKREVSSVELTQQCLARIESVNPALNAFLTVTAEQALASAQERDRELARGVDRGPLHGIPIALKDIFATKGVRTTNGSKLYENHVPEQDAIVVERLAEAGAVSLGKVGLHELAYGITSNNPWFGAIRNPWDPSRIPGGSSGGSGVAVAAGMAYMAMGTDTGGSIRIPASFCGIAGLKPTYGRVPTEGCMPLGFSLDHMGPMTRTIRDTALSMEALLPGESFAVGQDVRLDGVRVGIPTNFFFDRVDPEIAAAIRVAADALREAGATLHEVHVDAVEDLVTVARIILLCEAADAVGDYWHRREDFGKDVLTLFDQGRLIPATTYIRAQRLRQELAQRFVKVFTQCDCLLTPTTPVTAAEIGQQTIEISGVAEDTRLASTRLVRPINVTGAPALSLWAGKTRAGMPIGAQLIGPADSDAKLLRIATAIEDRIPQQAPPEL